MSDLSAIMPKRPRRWQFLRRRFIAENFDAQRVVLDGRTFIDCTFVRCKLIYRGGAQPWIDGCQIGAGSDFEFEGRARGAVEFIRNLSGSAAGNFIVRNNFPKAFQQEHRA